MVKTTFDKAERVAASIGRRLGRPPWFLGVGIDRDAEEGYSLSVRVEPGRARFVDLPDRINDVKIRVVERTMARPLI